MKRLDMLDLLAWAACTALGVVYVRGFLHWRKR